MSINHLSQQDVEIITSNVKKALWQPAALKFILYTELSEYDNGNGDYGLPYIMIWEGIDNCFAKRLIAIIVTKIIENLIIQSIPYVLITSNLI